jgi:hypothetical protein
MDSEKYIGYLALEIANTNSGRYKPPDSLLAFLNGLYNGLGRRAGF